MNRHHSFLAAPNGTHILVTVKTSVPRPGFLGDESEAERFGIPFVPFVLNREIAAHQARQWAHDLVKAADALDARAKNKKLSRKGK